MSIQDELNEIKTAKYGREVRGALHDGLKKGYEKAVQAEWYSEDIKKAYDDILLEWESNPNKDPEVIEARGEEVQLKDRLNSTDAQVLETENAITDAKKDKLDNEYSTIKERLDRQQYFFPAEGKNVVHLIAHRGSFYSPENTIQAMCDVGSRVKGVEVDVRLTSDGVPILMHDSTVTRTTNGSGTVASMTLSQIKELDAGSWLHSDFEGVMVPTLEEYLKVARELNMTMICLDPKTNVTEAYITAVTQAVKNAHMENRVIVLFRNASDMYLWREHEQLFSLGFLGANESNITEYITACKENNGMLIYLAPGEANIIDNRTVIEEIHDNGLLVGGSIANDTKVVIDTVTNYGLDVIMTDNASAFYHLTEVRSYA